MVSLDSDCVTSIEVLVELVTRPSDGEHLFFYLRVSRLCIGESAGGITDRVAFLQQYCS